MLAGDQDEFDALLKQLGEVFNRKIEDTLAKTYWNALKDLPLPTVVRYADKHIRHGKFFPKPFELRPRDEPKAEESNAAKAAHDEALRFNRETWDELFRKEPARAAVLSRSAHAAAMMSRFHPSEEGYRQWKDIYEQEWSWRERLPRDS